MNPMMVPQSRPELLWAEQLFDDGELALWQFRSFDRELSLSLAPMQMQSVCPEGQWVLVELYGQHTLWRLGSVQALPVTVGKQQLERQLAWLAEEQRTLLLDVWSMLAYIGDKALQSFLLDVLTDEGIMRSFCQSRASHRHHHDQSGGLLAHSHEVAMTAAMLCTQHRLGQRSSWVAFIGGLLHDIGKIHLYYNEPAGVCGQHEAYNFMVLARPLEQLRADSPQLFEALSSCLTAKTGKYADPYQVANVVRMSDRLSADVFNWKSAFARVPGYYWYTKSPRDEQLYKRLG
jgi:predicted HD phosphohydrolase